MRPGQGKDDHLIYKGIEYFIDRSLCHVPTWLAAAWWRIHTTEENPKRLGNNIDYLNKEQKTLDQVTTSILDRLHSFLSITIHAIQHTNTYPYTPFLYYPFLTPNPTFLYNLILLGQPIHNLKVNLPTQPMNRLRKVIKEVRKRTDKKSSENDIEAVSFRRLRRQRKGNEKENRQTTLKK